MRITRILLLFSAAIVCFLVPSAQAKPPVRVVNKELHCSMEVPDGWKRKADMLKTMWLYTGPKDAQVAPNISVTFAPNLLKTSGDAVGVAGTFNEKSFEKSYFNRIGRSYNKIGTVYDTKKTMFHGQPAYSYRASTNFSGRPDFEVYQISCIYNTCNYIITFVEPAALKKKYDPIGNKIFASFQFDK